MIRSLYSCLIQLHPYRFRRHYGEEMLWIFDQTKGAPATFVLFTDAVTSLIRQWTMRPQSSTALVRQDGGPRFDILVSSPPSGRILLSGTLSSLLLFAAVAAAIAHGAKSGMVAPPQNMAASASTPAAASLSAKSLPAAPGNAPGSVSGTVLNARTGKPLANAMVASFGSGWRKETITDSQGRYRLDGLQPGSLPVVVSGLHRTPFWDQRISSLASGENARNVDFVVYPHASIAGRVLDKNGEPAPHAVVNFLTPQYEMGELRYTFSGRAVADDRGEYNFQSDGLAASHEFLAWVQIPQRGREALSNTPKNPALRALAFQPTFYPSAIRLEEAERIHVSIGEQKEGVDIRLQQAPDHCVEAQANAAAGPRPTLFWLQSVQPSFGPGASRPTVGILGTHGAMRICGLTTGDYRLSVATGRPESAITMGRAAFSIADKDVKDLQVQALPRIPLQGRVDWAGTPPAQPIDAPVLIQLQSLQELAATPEAHLAVPGKFVVQAFLDDYRVSVKNLPSKVYVQDVTYGGESVLRRPLRLGSKPAGTELLVTLAQDGGSLQAQVVKSDGTPAAGATVHIIPKRATTPLQLAETRIAGLVNPLGIYVSPALPPGEYFVLATELHTNDLSPETVKTLFDERLHAKTIVISPNAVIHTAFETTPWTEQTP